MGSPQPWPPYDVKDCSQAYCSYYCPQYCPFLFPPPPPSSPSNPTTLSPLLIAVVSMISTAFLLTACYIVLFKFRHHFHSSPPTPHRSPSPTHASPSVSGLDDTLISKIASCQYRPSDGLVADGTDCSVCLGGFKDGERLRLLPQCGHAFHVPCIDTWLRVHSTCPLCRGSIVVSTNETPPVVTTAESESITSHQAVEIV